MLSNLFDQIFGRTKCGKREIITTTIIEPESINIIDESTSNESVAGASSSSSSRNNQNHRQQRCCLLPSFSLSDIATTSQSTATVTSESNFHSQPQCKQPLLNQYHQNADKHHQTNQHNIRNNQNKLNEISIFSIYLLFATLFVCICTIAVLLFTYINRTNDIAQLRDTLTSEFIVRGDIDEIIRNVLKDFKNDNNNNNDDDDAKYSNSRSSSSSSYEDNSQLIGDFGSR